MTIYPPLEIPETLAAGPGPGNTDPRVLERFAKDGRRRPHAEGRSNRRLREDDRSVVGAGHFVTCQKTAMPAPGTKLRSRRMAIL